MATETAHASAAPADPKADELKALREELKTLQISRVHQRRRLTRFERTHKTAAKHLPTHAKESTDDHKQSAVRLTYQLLRSFCFSYNWLNSDKDAEKFCIPPDFEAELKDVLTEKYFSKFADAIKASKEEFKSHLPAEVPAEVCDHLLKFVSIKEKDHILSKYEGIITDLTDKITGKTKERDAISPPAPRKERKPREAKPRNRRDSGGSESETPLEDRLHEIMMEVAKRTNSVHFSKDDHASYSEAQSQLDALLKETVTEILEMKQGLRKRFARVQSSRRARTTRRPKAKN